MRTLRKTLAATAAAALVAAGMGVVGPATALAATGDVSVRITAVGDCTLGTDSGFNYSTSLNAMYSAKGPKYFLKKVKPLFSRDDLTIANLEGTLTTRGSRAAKTFAFRGKPYYTKILTSSSVEAVTFANNHAYDYGTVSHSDTIRYCRKAGLHVASYSRVATYKVKGVKIAMVAVNDIETGTNPETLIKKGIAKAHRKHADAITVSIHAGIEKMYTATSRQRELAHYAVNHGADLVIGHHPHVMGGIERYKGVTIAYSLGNFCFGGNSNPFDKRTLILQKTFNFKNGKLVKDKAVRVIPASVSSHSTYNDYQPRVLTKAARRAVLRKVNSLSTGARFKMNGHMK